MSVPATKAVSDTEAFGRLTYLVIDDFENFRLSMRHMLRRCGAKNIELVASAQPAIHYCTYNKVDVVLCDYNLGEGQNGQHVLEELRHKKLLKRTSLFLMVTSETSREMVMGARENQPDAYLTKPINYSMLAKRLGSLVSQRKALLAINREIDRENYPEAISLCMTALSRVPRYKTWLMKTLGELYFLLGDLSHAIKVYEGALSKRELSWARLGLSKALLANHRYDEAVQGLKQLIANHPDYVEAYDLLAEGFERQNRPRQAQKVLERATSYSPTAVLRQKHLAELAESNQDMKTAAQAWRQTVNLGALTIHDNASHYLSLSLVLCDLSEGRINKEGEELAAEAFSTLEKLKTRFPNNDILELRSKIIQCRIHKGQERLPEANALLGSIRPKLKNSRSLGLEAALDYAKTLDRLGYESNAKVLLKELAEQFCENPEAIIKIESLLDEPVSFRTKIKARRLNREGIAAFESGNLKEARNIFANALKLIPNHPALNLNQVQVLMKEYSATNKNTDLIMRCIHHLDRLANLPEQHSQYRRYLVLQRKLKALSP